VQVVADQAEAGAGVSAEVDDSTARHWAYLCRYCEEAVAVDGFAVCSEGGTVVCSDF
jgi:hypothetical protein